jgi:hypothetical protein
MTRYERDNVVPFSFSYPADWQKVAPGNDVLLSPRAQELVPLFLPGNSTGGWTATGEMVSEYPDDVVGVFTFSTVANDAASPVEDQKVLLSNKLPPVTSFTGADTHASLGHVAATRLTGQMTDPVNKGAALHFECYIAAVPQTSPRTAFVIFFAWKNSFASHRGTFDRIAASVDLRQ